MGKDKTILKDTIFFKDKNRFGMLKINEIEAITYYSVKRESEFHLSDGRKFNIKKKFSEIEMIQETYPDFLKIERGTIINLNLIYFLDYKELRVVFKSGNTLLLNRTKLKQLEEYLTEKYSCLMIWTA